MFWHERLTLILLACVPTLIVAAVLQDSPFYYNIVIGIGFWAIIDATVLE